MAPRRPEAPTACRSLRGLAALLLGLAGALGLGADTVLAAPPSSAPTVPMRLPASVAPQAVAVQLEIDPEQPRHQGTVQIDLKLATPLAAGSPLRLHAQQLQIQSAWVELGARRHPARVQRLDREQVALRFATALPAGAARLGLAFSGQVSDRDVDGIFRQQEDGRWLVYTQFQPTGARRAFPLFDEPGWKLPWTLTLTIPPGLQALSNMAPVSDEPAERPGWRRIRFATTPPLPSYLLAFAVGRFDIVDGGRIGREGGTPLRYVAPVGRGGQAGFAAETTGPVLAALEAWFDMPHPFAKLDSVAMPLTSGFSAMEHPGLVTYASNAMLAARAEQTPHFERDYVALAAHELAHQWFGNLVTLAWWDDLWLNESFASWLGDKITAQVQPGWRWQTSQQHARARAMQADRLASARRIQQPVLQDEDMGNLWDAITYDKGQAVLGMFEAWLGEEAFRDGVRRFIRRHAWGVATSDDFFRALGETDAALPAAVKSFTQQGGIPRLAVRLECAAGQAPRLRLAQQRLLPLGSAAVAPQVWQIPVVLRTPAGTQRLLLATPEAELALGTGADTPCPAWVLPNASGAGYHRAQLQGDLLQRLLAHPEAPTLAEWLVLLDDARGLHEAGELDTPQLLALVRAGAAHADDEVQAAAAQALARLRPLVGPAQQAAYAAWWQAVFGPRARALGWLPQAAEPDPTRRLRAALLGPMASDGADAALQAQAITLTRAWLADRGSLPAEARTGVLAAAATSSQGLPEAEADALFQALAEALATSRVRSERGDLLTALGHFRQPALAARARALLLDERVDLRDSLWPLLKPQAQHAATRGEARQWLLRQHAALSRRVGREDPAWWPDLFREACNADEAQALQVGFGPLAGRYQGGAAQLARTLESVRLCTAWRATQAAPVALSP